MKTNNPETRGTLVTQDTVRRQTIQRHGEHWSHKTQYEDKQSRDTDHSVHKTHDEDKQSLDTDNIGYTKYRMKTNNPETLTTLCTQDRGRK